MRLNLNTPLFLLGITALIGCGSTNPASQTQTPTASFDFALRVQLQAGDTPQSLAQRLGGEVVVFDRTHGYALLGGNGSSGLSAQSSSEPNRRIFLASGRAAWMNGQSGLWAGGQSSLWASGQSNLWAGGQSSLWASGQYRLFPQNTNPWQQIKLDDAHLLAPMMGRGIKVAVIDTGVDLNHPMIASSLVPANEHWDFVGNDAIPQEEGSFGTGGFGHGTNVAGIVLQVAPAAKIMPLRVLGPDGRGDVLHLAAAIDWAVNRGARVINMSLGSDQISPAVETALQAATARGVLVVSSAGNLGSSSVSYPASQAHLEHGFQRLSVTSIRADFAKSSFANFGESIEIAAPGEAIFGPAPGNRIAAWSGTSMAAPMVSGALALALAEPLSVPVTELADKLHQSSSGEIYNNANNQAYPDQVGKGSLDLEVFLNNVISR